MDLPPVESIDAIENQVQECIVLAAKKYNVPWLLLKAIREKEGGKVGGYSHKTNSNGTRDIGPMQINEIWLKELNAYGIDEETLRDNPCTNVYTGAYVLRHYYDHHGRDWFRATASYNAGFRIKNGEAYARDVMQKWYSMHNKAVATIAQ